MIPTKPPLSFRSPDKWSSEFIDFVTYIINLSPNVTYIINLFQAIFMIPTKPALSFRSPDKWSSEFIDFVSKCHLYYQPVSGNINDTNKTVTVFP